MVFIRAKCGLLSPKIVCFFRLKKNIVGPLQSPKGICQSSILDSFLAKMAKTVKIFKMVLRTLFSRLQTLTKCKVSEKNNERFPRKSVTYGRTDGRTSVRTAATPKVSNDRWSRDQKGDNFRILIR